MLTIRQQQIEAFREQPRLAFEREMARYLRRYFPFEAANADLDRWVRSGLNQAGQYGFLTEYESALYLAVMAMLGAGFLDDPTLPWARQTICDAGTPAVDRITSVYEKAIAFLDAACGPQGVWFDRAIVRLCKQDMTVLDLGTHPRALEGRILATMAELYPQKAAAVGDKAVRKLVRAGVEQAGLRGAISPRAGFIHAVLMYYLGAGFVADPCFPWASAAFLTARDTDQAYDEMHRSALDYLQRSLQRGA